MSLSDPFVPGSISTLEHARRAIEDLGRKFNALQAGHGVAGDAVDSFNGRTGAVVPVAGDYAPAFIGAVPITHLTDTDPHPQYQRELQKGLANGYAGLNILSHVPPEQLGSGLADNTTYLRGDGTWNVVVGGDGGGPAGPRVWYWDTPPSAPSLLDDEFNLPLAGWTSIGAAVPVTTVAGGKLDMSVPFTGAGFNLGGIEKALPPGNFSVITKLSELGTANYSIVGMHIRNVTTGKMLRFIMFRNSAAFTDTFIGVHRYDSLTVRTAVMAEVATAQLEFFLRISYDGTNISFDRSFDGVTWIRHYTEAIGVEFGASLPDRVGFSIDPYSGSTDGRLSAEFFRYYPLADQITGGLLSGGTIGAIIRTTWDPFIPDTVPHALTDEFDDPASLADWSQVYTGDAGVVCDIASTVSKGLYIEAPSVFARFRSLMKAIPAGDFTIHTAITNALLTPTSAVAAFHGIMIADGVTAGAGNQTMASIKKAQNGGLTMSRLTWGKYGDDATSAAEGTADWVNSTPIFLRVRRVSGAFFMAFSDDGQIWYETALALLGAMTPTHIGLALNNYAGGIARARFHYFRVYATGTQYKTGAVRNVMG